MHNAFNSDYYEVNRVKHLKRRNYDKAKTAIRLIITATIAKTVMNRCITRLIAIVTKSIVSSTPSGAITTRLKLQYV